MVWLIVKRCFKGHNIISITKMVRIAILGIVADALECSEGANTEVVEKKLLQGFGKGILKRDGALVLSETLLAGDYEYHVTPQPAGKTNIICSHSSFSP
jgi:hypothetical protein